jgi:hypothetical protein
LSIQQKEVARGVTSLEKYRQAEQQQVARNGRVAKSEVKDKQNQKNREREYPILLI